MAHELVIEGNVFYKDKLQKCCLGIADGKIVEVKKVLTGETTIDVGDKLVLPGAIDPHVHFRHPGFPQKEDFTSGSLSAVFGGVTTVLDMPNTRPPVTTASAVAEKYLAVKGKSYIDYGLYCGFGPKTNVDRAALVCAAFKIYLGETTGEMGVDNDELLVKGMSEIMTTGLPVSVHCEDPLAINNWTPPKGEPKDTIDYNKFRPEEFESATVKRLSELKDVTAVHIAHLSSMASLAAKPASFTCEVTPHHLFLNERMGLKSRGKMNPPLRPLSTASDLWNALLSGKIDIVASDHAPHTIEEKDLPFNEAPAGVPGVETMVPLLLMKVRKNELHIERLVDIMARKTSAIFKLPHKGSIEVGMDADIMTVDMREASTIRARNLHSKCGWTPYEGIPAVFPKRVFLRGQQVVQDWEFVGDKAWGLPISRAEPKPKDALK